MPRRSRKLFLPLLSADFVAGTLMSWKHSSQVLNSGEYGGWNSKRTPQFVSKAVRTGSTKWPWWKPQLSIISVSPLSSTANQSALVRLTASSKNSRSSWPLDGPSSTFTKSTPNGECSRLIVYVALEGYRWILNTGSPQGAFPYFWVQVVFTTLFSSKQWMVSGSKSDIASRNSFRRWILSLLCDSDGICCIFFFGHEEILPDTLWYGKLRQQVQGMNYSVE